MYISVIVFTIISFSLFAYTPKDRGALVEGRKYFRKKQYEEAYYVFRSAHKQFPHSSILKLWYAKSILFRKYSSLKERNKEFSLAISLLEECKEIFSKNAAYHSKAKSFYIDALFYLGLGYYLLGYEKKALEAFLELLRWEDESIEGWYNLGVIYESMGKIVEANRAYRRYLSLLRKEEEEF